MALHECNPTPCGSRYGRNKLLANPGGIGTRRAIRSHGFTNPKATLPRPSHKTIPYPKALATSKGLPSFMTCQQARASLCATALMATTARPLVHFF